ncbi:MAG TPA: MMPL family transporter [Pirellulales bacterium]|nr:MMPL family transporter [Pirellulales bacterium]
MYERLGRTISRHWAATILAWIGIWSGLHLIAPRWDDVTRDGDLAYLPAEMVSVQGERLLNAAFPQIRSKSQMAVVLARDEEPLTSADWEAVHRLAERLGPDALKSLPIVEVWTPQTPVIGKMLASEDGRAALILVLLKNEFMAIENINSLDVVREVVEQTRSAADFPRGLRTGISGSAAIGGDMLASAHESVKNTEVATVVLVVLILLVVYRAPLLVLIPLIAITVSVAVSLDAVAQLTEINRIPGLEHVDFKVFKTTKIFVVVILFGSGTDFCLFLISRFREELERGRSQAEAVAAALSQVGEALVGSAMTTILGLGTMLFADFGKYRNSGPAIALCLAITLAACLTLAPALLRAFGQAVFWPFGVRLAGPNAADERSRTPARTRMTSVWDWISRIILARPVAILATSLLLLAPLAYRGLSVEVSYDLLEELRSDRPSVIGTRLLRRHFAPGDTGPIVVLAKRQGAHFDQRAGEQEIARLTKFLYDMPGVAYVRSIAEPLGDKPGYSNIFSPAGRRKLAAKKHPQTKAIYLSQVPSMAGDVARLDVVLKYDPFSAEAVSLLGEIDRRLQGLSDDPQSPWHETEFAYTGATAGIRDLKAVTQSDQTLIERLVVIAVLGVLIFILRRPLICLYLILSVLFSYLVTIGATELIFSWLYSPFNGLDWKVPIFLFVILTAIGEDYNIYLVTRVLEEQKRFGLLEGLRLAVVRTGGIITSCGVIMAGTFLSMMFGTLRGMLELGFALSLGVLLDTLVVRSILVPAFLALMYRREARSLVADHVHPAEETIRPSGARVPVERPFSPT